MKWAKRKGMQKSSIERQTRRRHGVDRETYLLQERIKSQMRWLETEYHQGITKEQYWRQRRLESMIRQGIIIPEGI